MTILVGIIGLSPAIALLGMFAYMDYIECKEEREYREWLNGRWSKKRD